MKASKWMIISLIALLCIGAILFFSFLNPLSPQPNPSSEQGEEGRAGKGDEPGEIQLSAEEAKKQAVEQKVEAWLEELSLEEKVGQMFMPHLGMWEGKNTTEMNEQLQRLLQELHIGGVILFEKNIETIEGLVTFTDQLQQQSPKIPLLISLDQEGGRVKRIPEGTNMPGNMALGATRSSELAYQVGNVLGTELHALGVNVNFAPTLDVNNNPKNPVIGIRSFGEDPALVAELGLSYIQGLQDARVMATAKHFPGHGDTDVDSHLGLPVLHVDRQRLEKVELYPFRQAIEQGVDMIMTAHVTFPKLDNTQVISKKDGTQITLPATLSYKILTELLREELGFQGVIVTDSFEMKAIKDHFGEEEAVVQSIQAGADIILMPHDLERSYKRVLEELSNGGLKEERIDQSVRRILTLKAKYDLLPEPGSKASEAAQDSLQERLEYAQQLIGNQEHKYFEQTVSAKAMTLLKNEDHLLPFPMKKEDHLLIIAPNQQSADNFEQAIDELLQEEEDKDKGNQSPKAEDKSNKGSSPDLLWKGKSSILILSEDQSPSVWEEAIERADYVLLATQAVSQSASDDVGLERLKQLFNLLEQKQSSYAWLALDTPYDILVHPEAKAYLALYGAQLPNIKAGLQVIFGLHQPAGKLPVTVPQAIENQDDASGASQQKVLFPFGSGIVNW